MMAMLLRFDSVGFFTFDTTGSFAFFLLPGRELGSLIGVTFFLDTFWLIWSLDGVEMRAFDLSLYLDYVSLCKEEITTKQAGNEGSKQ